MHLLPRLQHSVSNARCALRDFLLTGAGMLGLSFPQQQPLRALLSFGLLAAGVAVIGFGADSSARAASVCFVLALALRHGFLFASFAPAGLVPWAKRRFGVERAWLLFEAALTTLMFAQRLSFVLLLCATAEAPAGYFGVALIGCGAVLVVTGVALSVWATRVISLDTYNHRDLFMGLRYMTVELRGPYAFWRNPLYGVGQLAAYGAALIALSPLGFLAAALQQITLYIFNDAMEQPRLRAAKGLFMESQLRYALSRTLSLDPRADANSRRSSRPPARVPRAARSH